MQSTQRRLVSEFPTSNASGRTAPAATLRSTENQQRASRRRSLAASNNAAPQVRPYVVPSAVPTRQTRKAPLAVRVNRALRTVLVAFAGLAIAGYGFDVAASHDVGRLQEQARRLNEQNSELSADLLKTISYQSLQDNVLGHCGLRVPEHVIIVKESAPPRVPAFKPNKHHLPIISGY